MCFIHGLHFRCFATGVTENDWNCTLNSLPPNNVVFFGKILLYWAKNYQAFNLIISKSFVLAGVQYIPSSIRRLTAPHTGNLNNSPLICTCCLPAKATRKTTKLVLTTFRGPVRYRQQLVSTIKHQMKTTFTSFSDKTDSTSCHLVLSILKYNIKVHLQLKKIMENFVFFNASSCAHAWRWTSSTPLQLPFPLSLPGCLTSGWMMDVERHHRRQGLRSSIPLSVRPPRRGLVSSARCSTQTSELFWREWNTYRLQWDALRHLTWGAYNVRVND